MRLSHFPRVSRKLKEFCGRQFSSRGQLDRFMEFKCSKCRRSLDRKNERDRPGGVRRAG